MRVAFLMAGLCASSVAVAQVKSITDPSAFHSYNTTGTARPPATVSPAPARTSAPSPVIAAQPVAPVTSSTMTLPTNTELTLRMNDELTSKNARVGTMFNLSVTDDVIYQNYVVIPRGTRGVGEVTWLTGKGAFGKSGKMEIQLRYLELGGRHVGISGKYRQEGEGNTVATVGAVVAVGVFGAFVTGHSAVIPQGRELKAYTDEPLAFAAAAPVQAPIQASLVAVSH